MKSEKKFTIQYKKNKKAKILEYEVYAKNNKSAIKKFQKFCSFVGFCPMILNCIEYDIDQLILF